MVTFNSFTTVQVKALARSVLHYQLPVAGALGAGYFAGISNGYLLTAYAPLLVGLLGVERSTVLVRYFVFRTSLAQPLRALLWLVDRSILAAAGAVVGPWILLSLVLAYGTVLVTQLLVALLRLFFPSLFLVGGMMLFSELGLKQVSAGLLLFGVMYLLYTVSQLVYGVLIKGGMLDHVTYHLSGGFGGTSAVSARDYSGVLAQVGTGSLLAASTYAAVDWQAAELPAPDAGLVNGATGLPMLGNGSFIDVGGNPYGFDMHAGFDATPSTTTYDDPFNT